MTPQKQERVDALSIDLHTSMLDAIKLMDTLDRKLLLVLKGTQFHSLLSIGDIQRAIIKGHPLDTHVSSILRDNIQVCDTSHSHEHIRSLMLNWRMEFMPVLDERKQLHDLIFWDELFEAKSPTFQGTLDLPVVIMAGGFGSRLKPITNVIPKPLVPIGEKPILQLIVEKFARMGAQKFYFSVNYKAYMIQDYFKHLDGPKYDIDYFMEDKPLGTAGSLQLLKDKIKQTFFVSNCDILIDQDFEAIHTFHKENKHELTLVAALKHLQIPYGTVEVQDGGLLDGLKEKPELTYLVNAGMYLLEPHLIDEIPEGEFYHITDLIHKVKERGGRVGVFPVSEGSWLDIGEWKEYLKTQAIFEKRMSKD
tara:strand:+ start:13857 stop:14948 length:1092 start_codon:yes stop_codon:yes gene_type:complete